MRILVTGGAGFIGANFLRRVVPAHPEHVFINADALTYAANPLSLEGLEELENYRFERVDIADAAAVGALFQSHRPDAVVHLAAESHVDRSIVGPGAFLRTNVQGTFTLLEACRRQWSSGEGLFHHVSTDEVYGSLDEGRFTESSAYDPSSPYSASKAASDHLVRAWARTYGLRCRITNCSNNFGPYQFPEKLVPLMILNAVAGEPLPIYGTGENVRDWIYVDDHCDALWAVFCRGEDGETYNVGGSGERRNVDVVDAICAVVAEQTGRDPASLTALKTFVPDRPGHDQRYAVDASKLQTALGWRPKETFESGLQKTVQWYLENDTWVESVRSGAYREWIETQYGPR